MTNVNSVDSKALSSYLERWSRLDEEKKAISGDQKEILAEAKAKGFDPKAMRRIIRDQKAKAKDAEKFTAEMDAYDVYARAIDLFS